MPLLLRFYWLLCLSALCSSVNNAAAQGASSVKAELSLGFETDSYLDVEELEENRIQSDVALKLKGKLKFYKPLNDRDKLKLKYSFIQREFNEFSSFDRLTHIASAGIRRSFKHVKAGVTGRFVKTELDSQGLFELKQLSASISGFLDDRYYLRGGYQFTDKDYQRLTQRSSDVHALDLSLYSFADGVRDYWVLELKAAYEDANADRFDRAIVSLEARYHKRYYLFEKRLKAKLHTRFQVRDHGSDNPFIGAKRNDDRFRIGAELEYSLSANTFIELTYRYSDYKSNLPVGDYSQNKVNVQFGWRHQ